MRAARRLGTIGPALPRDRGADGQAVDGGERASTTRRLGSAPSPVARSATPRVPRPRLTLYRSTPPGDSPTGGLVATTRRAALAAFLAQPESVQARATLLRALDGIDRGAVGPPVPNAPVEAAAGRDARCTTVRLVR